MSPRTPLTFFSIAETIKAGVVLIVALATALGLISSIGFWVLEPRLSPWIKRVSKIDLIEAQVNTLLSYHPPPPIVRFEGNPVVSPQTQYAGEKISVTYRLQRNVACGGTVLARFYSEDTNGFDASLSYSFENIQSPVTAEPRAFTVDIRLPDGIDPGHWAYEPEIRPGPQCPSQEPIYPPPARFVVAVPR